MPVTPNQIADALGAHEWQERPALPGRRNHLKAGIMIPLRWDPTPIAVCTLRPEELSHGGEICWPGGRPELGDADLFATAAREAREELGITSARLLGRLSSIPLFTSDHRLEPFVAEIDESEFIPQPSEVAAVIEVDVVELLSSASLPGIPWVRDGEPAMAPVFDVDGHWMYGATAFVFAELLSVIAPVFGRELPPLHDAGISWNDVLPAEFTDKHD